MKIIKKLHASTKQFNDDINHIERSGIKGRAKSYTHKLETNTFLNLPRSVGAISSQIRKLLNHIRLEASR